MEPKRTLHSGNLVRGFYVGDILLKDGRWMGRKMTQKTTKEGQEIFDLKPLTEEEMVFYWGVRQDDIREAFAVLEGTIEIVEER